MAREYLAKNSESLEAESWFEADGTAGSGFVDEADLVIGSGTVPITDDVDWSTITGGVNTFMIGRGRKGPVGRATAPLRFDVNATGESLPDPAFYDLSGDDVYYAAAGDADVCARMVIEKSAGGMHLLGGTFSKVEQSAGYLYAAPSVVITSLQSWGGRSEIDPNATAMTECRLFGGVHTLRRGGKIEVLGPAQVTLNIEDGSDTELIIADDRARVTVLRGDIPKLDLLAGDLVLTGALRDLVIGDVRHTAGPPSRARLHTDSRHTITEPVRYGPGTESIGGASPAPGL